jgi:hypothetical protein
VAVVLAVGGCSLLPSRQLTYTFPAWPQRAPGDPAVPALPIVVTDDTGGVVAVGEAPDGVPFASDQGIAFDPGRPNAVMLHWSSGPCDTRVTVDIASTETVDMVVTTFFRGVCDPIGIEREVMVSFRGRVDPSRIGVRFTYEPEAPNT